MAHQRKRYIEKLISKTLKFSPLIGVLGHRQVGKTTWLEAYCENYLTLDNKNTLNEVLSDEELFLQKNRKMTAIDECQLAPSLFSALKEQVRKNKKPGQFILSGSVRFTSQKAIQESLTGRIVNFELLPFSISEIAHADLPKTVEMAFKLNSIDQIVKSIQSQTLNSKNLLKEFNYYFERGGLPGVCFINDQKIRETKIKDQLYTILDRDLRSLYISTLPYLDILNFLKYIAKNQGVEFNYSNAKKETGLAVNTQKKLIYAFEALFLIRRLSIYGKVNTNCFYLEDQAESKFLSESELSEEDYFSQLVYRNIRVQFYYQLGMSFKEFIFKTRGQIHIPYAVTIEGSTLGFLPIAEEYPNKREKGAAKTFLSKINNSKIIYISKENVLSKVDDRSFVSSVLNFV